MSSSWEMKPAYSYPHWPHFTTSSSVSGWRIAIGVSVCTCLSTHISKTRPPKFHQIFNTLPLTVAWSSSNTNSNAICYIFPVLWRSDVTFSYSCCLLYVINKWINKQICQNQRQYFSWSSWKFNVPLDTLQVISETILQVRWPNQQCNSTEGW